MYMTMFIIKKVFALDHKLIEWEVCVFDFKGLEMALNR